MVANTATKISDPLLNITDDFLRDPYKYYKQLRDADPIYWSEEGDYWLVTGYEEADLMLRDLRFGKTHHLLGRGSFLSSMAAGLVSRLLPRSQSMLNMNPPDHTRIRSLVNKTFTPKMIEQMRVHIQEITDNLIDKIQNKKQVDLVAEFAFPLPVNVIAEMLGVPAKDQEQFKHWSRNLAAVLEPTTNLANLFRAVKARQEFINYLRPLIEMRRKEPKDDLISSLVQVEEQGDKLSETEMFTNIMLLLAAGHETTVNLISNSMLALLTNPDQYDLLKSKPDLIGSAVEEFLRFDGPVQAVRRIAMEDIILNDKTIKTGQNLMVLVGAADRDPKRFADPDKLDITRTNNKHLAFGFGIHHCVGYALATAEGQIAVDTLLKRLPNMKLAMDTKDLRWKRPFSLRGPQTLMVSF
jgi:cytochrome P450